VILAALSGRVKSLRYPLGPFTDPVAETSLRARSACGVLNGVAVSSDTRPGGKRQIDTACGLDRRKASVPSRRKASKAKHSELI